MLQFIKKREKENSWGVGGWFRRFTDEDGWMAIYIYSYS